MRFHAGALRTAALVAAVFVATRVVYRIVFGGAGGSGILLLDLPRIPLGGPFAHVALFGPITTGGLWNAALSALPFAAVILAFGLVNAVVDMRRLFVHGSTRGPLRAISRSLVIAWSTAPALAQAVRRLRRAAALRGERGRAALLVPVFEQTIERALALAASMEVRGFAARHPLPAATPLAETHAPVAELTDAGLHRDGATLLSGMSFTITPGTFTVLVGPTGAGKSSLLRGLDGLFQHFDGGQQSGRIRVAGLDRATTPPRETAAFVGSVAQNVRLGFATATVHEEIGFALAVQGVAEPARTARVRATAELLTIGHLLDRDIVALSAGEATLVAIAAAVVARPRLLLVDEPLAELDDAARLRVSAALGGLVREQGVAVIVAEHQWELWQPLAQQWLQIDSGRVRVSAEAPAELPAERLEAPPAAPAAAACARHPLAHVRGLSVTHDGATVVDGAAFELAAGELVALSGPNGAGKSSLLLAMALADAAGTVLVAGDDVAALAPAQRRRRIALVPERVDELFLQTSVAAECRRADRADSPAVPTDTTFARLLGQDAGSPSHVELLLRHPRDLSAGQQLCLALAIQLAPGPDVLLVDEPSRGLDPATRRMVGLALQRAALHGEPEGGRAVLFATHDAGFARSYAERRLRLADGRLQAEDAAVPR
ncbi:ATP-binding cassette domain-containing protein [Microterricola viridarii]|uniref:ABC-type glutathione transport system ATPase component, contains duplicated ATPase domain n=1 Tax=Microterricola viridarii TaxID=412690 RepID=A0A1H1W868_9MICO|nr:ATP-binding cassette domain-containing protein [Microterricola viridarii]SDS93293.1 ABC-type glutathione transport system ATPase component, contains duplicated ATPase domain [Microterricola viridarii]